jgi:hypothetical protein
MSYSATNADRAPPGGEIRVPSSVYRVTNSLRTRTNALRTAASSE